MDTFKERIAPALTIENAQAYRDDPEKWMFVTDLMSMCDISYDPHSENTERRVRWIEKRLDKLLKNSL